MLHAVSSHVRRATGLGPRIHLVRLLYFRLAAAGTGVVAHSGLRSQFERIRIPRGVHFQEVGGEFVLIAQHKKEPKYLRSDTIFGSKCIQNAFAAGAPPGTLLAGLRPEPCWRSSQRFLRFPYLDLGGHFAAGKGGKQEGRGRGGKQGEGREEGKVEGRTEGEGSQGGRGRGGEKRRYWRSGRDASGNW